MRSGKQLILATKPFAKENRTTSWLHTLSTLVLLAACLGGAALAPFFAMRLVCSIISGLLVVRFFVIYHDYEHHTILQKSPAARIIMTIFGVYILAPESIWKRSHDYHHNHNSKLFTADIGSYPIATKTKFLGMSRGERTGYLMIRHPLTIIFGYITIFMMGMSLRSFISCPRRHYDSLVALVLHVAGSVLIFWLVGWQAWLLLVFIPFFVACGLGSYLFYAQHNFPGVTFTEKEGWTYESAAMESSSYMRMNPVMAWFTGNIGYHHIHHLNAKIPFYRLPETMQALPELQHAKTTSLYPGDVLACFRLKIWDPEQNAMTGIPRR
jgi:omega-6 fatty acid desaturase (delta-12 desaturase)